MNFLEKIIAITHYEMEEPTLYGITHIFFIILAIAAVFLVCLTCRNLNDKKINRILLISGCFLLFLEVIKQFNFAYDPSSDSWEYSWKQFPFQFCSVPMYVMVIVSLVKNEKIKSALYTFLGTFGLFAGLGVLLFPTTVLSGIVFRFSQSMIHHSVMFVIGVLLYVSKRIELNHKTILKAVPVFMICVVIAFTMNVLFHLFGNETSFNMFYIGPYSKSDIPILFQIGQALKIESPVLHFGNFLFVFIYIIGFSLIAYLVLLIAISINKLIINRKTQSIN